MFRTNKIVHTIPSQDLAEVFVLNLMQINRANFQIVFSLRLYVRLPEEERTQNHDLYSEKIYDLIK